MELCKFAKELGWLDLVKIAVFFNVCFALPLIALIKSF